MTEIQLGIDPSILNVIKYGVVALILTPLFEILADSLVSAKSTYDVLSGHTIEFSHSQLGIFSLHGTYWGRSRNRFMLIALGFAVIATELLFEFSFSSTTVDLEEVRQVWKQPSHAQRYIPAAGRERIELYREPTEFPGAVALRCTRGPRTMLRYRSNHTDGNERYQGGLEFRLNGNYTIRMPYRARSDDEVLCSATQKTAKATFIVPRVVRTRTASQVEGVSLEVPTSGYKYIKSIVQDNPPPVIDLFLYTDTEVGEVRSGDNGTCAGSWCLIRDRDRSFVLVFWTFESIVVVIKASGNALEGLTERGRQVRLILTIIYENLFTGIGFNELSPSLRVAEKNDMETLARWMIVAANEEGVGGLKAATVNRTVVGGSRQMATATGYLPASVSGLALIGSLLMVSCLLVRVMIARMGDKQQPFAVRFWRQWRLQTTKQYMRAKMLEDLQHYGFCESVTLQNIGFRLDTHGGPEATLRLIPIDLAHNSVELSFTTENQN
ncbi:hypothetical protein BWQ96_04832 [Gracilariopsis chorda]|uniref:Uncharacterized protein n=1 Tax=Gracilariopsis chorda TaxID=448386 RepID=A0A2V3IUL8_9FLOR|nr:hypothetical protein BWQ96_04832 [Gracilariopsis chorda]|eukprot:PXF45417.1 hypothetical protein BWQ96_04832 [Gracilariopsis chorda]